MGVVTLVLGEAADYGLTMAIGLPFILNGIGLDVIFILVKGVLRFQGSGFHF